MQLSHRLTMKVTLDMSIKLYNGLRLVDASLSLFDVIEQLAPQVRATFDDVARQRIAEHATLIVDSPIQREEHPGAYLFGAAEREWLASQNVQNRHSAPHDPLRFEIVFGRAPSGCTLAYPFSFGGTYDKAIEKTGLFTDYHYQDQTDRPDEIDVEEWAQRNADWQAITDAEGTFSSLPLWRLAGSIENVFNYLDRIDTDPNLYVSPETRLLRAVTNAVSRHLISQKGYALMPGFEAAKSASRAYLATDEGRALKRPGRIPALTTPVSELEPVFETPDDIVQTITDRAVHLLQNPE